MPIDKRLIEALEAGKVFTADDNAYVDVVSISTTGVTACSAEDSAYGDGPFYYPLTSYGKTWANKKEEIK